MVQNQHSEPKKIAHIGIAVTNLEQSLPFYTETLGLSLEGVEEIESEGVKVAFLKIGESRIELLEPLNDTSPIKRYIDSKGEGVHHIALEVDDIHDRVATFNANGIKMINEQPKRGAGDSLIAFIHPKAAHGVLYEMCEHDEEREE